MTDKVDDYFKKQPSPQKEICEKLPSLLEGPIPTFEWRFRGVEDG